MQILCPAMGGTSELCVYYVIHTAERRAAVGIGEIIGNLIRSYFAFVQ